MTTIYELELTAPDSLRSVSFSDSPFSNLIFDFLLFSRREVHLHRILRRSFAKPFEMNNER